MVTIQTVNSRLKRLDGALANGILSVHPSAPFTITEGGLASRITQNVVSVNVVNGVLQSPLTLAPCQGTTVAPASGVTYLATLRFGGVEESQRWIVKDTDTVLEITNVTLA